MPHDYDDDAKTQKSYRPLALYCNVFLLSVFFCWLVIKPTLGGSYALGLTFVLSFTLIAIVRTKHIFPWAVVRPIYLLGSNGGWLLVLLLAAIFKLVGSFLSQFFHPYN